MLLYVITRAQESKLREKTCEILSEANTDDIHIHVLLGLFMSAFGSMSYIYTAL
jgi:hypothetical protein